VSYLGPRDSARSLGAVGAGWTVLDAGRRCTGQPKAGTGMRVWLSQAGEYLEAQQPHFFSSGPSLSPASQAPHPPGHARLLRLLLVVSRVSMAWKWPSSP
jgi:hypothetical protein